MYARVTRWEGATAEAQKAMIDQISSAEGPPPGVPSNGITVLVDPKSGSSLVIGLFKTEEDLQKGHEALEAMSPDIPDSGRRTSVEMYEVGVERRLD